MDTVRAIHEQDGVAIAAHPFTHLLIGTDMKGVGRQLADLPVDGVEVCNSAPTGNLCQLDHRGIQCTHVVTSLSAAATATTCPCWAMPTPVSRGRLPAISAIILSLGLPRPGLGSRAADWCFNSSGISCASGGCRSSCPTTTAIAMTALGWRWR